MGKEEEEKAAAQEKKDEKKDEAGKKKDEKKDDADEKKDDNKDEKKGEAKDNKEELFQVGTKSEATAMPSFGWLSVAGAAVVLVAGVVVIRKTVHRQARVSSFVAMRQGEAVETESEEVEAPILG